MLSWLTFLPLHLPRIEHLSWDIPHLAAILVVAMTVGPTTLSVLHYYFIISIFTFHHTLNVTI